MSITQALPAFPQGATYHSTIAKPLIPEVKDRAEAKIAAEGLESIFLRMLIKDMRKNASAMGGEGFFGKGIGSGMNEDIFDSMLAARISKTGRLGLADAVFRGWEESGKIPRADKNQQLENGAPQ